MQAVVDAIDAGAGAGYIEICNAAYASVLCTIALAKPSFTEANGVLTMASPPRTDTSADNTGTAVVARIKDSNGSVKVSGLSVGTSNSDINLNSTAITSGQQVGLNSGTITHV